MYFDTHCHLNSDELYEDLSCIFARNFSSLSGIVDILKNLL